MTDTLIKKGVARMSLRAEFLKIVNSKVGQGYVWGGQNDDKLTMEKLNKLIATFGRQHYYLSGGVTAEKWIGKEYFDCSGLVVYTLTKLGLISRDYNADMLFHDMCVEIKKEDLREGDLCFVPNTSGYMVHVGTYNGSGVTHAQNTKNGVVKTGLLTSFKKFGRLKVFIQDEQVIEVPNATQPTLPFKDFDQVSAYAKDAVKKVKALGIMNGSDGNFNPKQKMSRQEMAVVMNAVLKYLGK
jgi:hypothetical protein